MSDNLDPHTLRDAALVHLHATVKAPRAEAPPETPHMLRTEAREGHS